MSGNIMTFNPNFIRSYTICPHGVRNTVTGEVITRAESTILETSTTTYVIEGKVTVENAYDLRVPQSKILDEKNTKKSDYRPHHMREGGYIYLRRSEIISQKICSNGVYDNASPLKNVITKNFAMVLETASKTYVIDFYLAEICESVFVQIPLTNILASCATKKADFISI